MVIDVSLLLEMFTVETLSILLIIRFSIRFSILEVPVCVCLFPSFMCFLYDVCVFFLFLNLIQMEGFCVFSPEDWNESGKDATLYAAEDLKKCLEGLARHLFGKLRSIQQK